MTSSVLRDTGVGMPADKETAAGTPAEVWSTHCATSPHVEGAFERQTHSQDEAKAKVSDVESQLNPVCVLYL